MKNIFRQIIFINKTKKAIKKSKSLINSKKDLAGKVRKHFDNILGEVHELLKLLPDLKEVYFEAIEIIENIK